MRLRYDLIDRAIAPYVGVVYERKSGDTTSYTRAEGEDRDVAFVVVGAKLMF
jgi:copper resistance protein B